MIGQLKVLLRIKQLKQEQAFRAMNVKRQQVGEALAAIETAQARERESAATLPVREDAIYSEIMHHVIDVPVIDETKARVVALEKEHARLVDAVERAVHVHARLEKELQDAVKIYRKTVKDGDKYLILTDEVGAAIGAQAERREEAEVEDIVNRRPKRAA
jgi:hypothetical protein